MTGAPPIGMHLYSLRHAARTDFEGVLRWVADVGFLGVEVEGLHGMEPARFRDLTGELGLDVISVHVEEDPRTTAREATALGTDTVIDGFYDLGPDDLRRQLAALDEAVAEGAPRGLRFGYHNHDREFTHRVDGRRAWDAILDGLDRAVFLELDYGHAARAGVDPLELLASIGDRVRLLHLHDELPGAFDVPAILAACPTAKWHIVEYEQRDRVFETLEASYRYLVGNGLSTGRR